MTTCAGCDATEGLTTMGDNSWCIECCPQAHCPNCLTSTGGQCRKHQEPECTCYEVTGGHMVGCAFNRPATEQLGRSWRERLRRLWDEAHETPDIERRPDFAAWSGATKDMLLGLGMVWDESRGDYTFKEEP